MAHSSNQQPEVPELEVEESQSAVDTSDGDDKEDRLISSVQKYPILFDLSSMEYKNTAHKEVIWQAIAVEVGLEAEACAKKGKLLRDTYVRKKKQLKEKSGQAAKRVRSWKHFGAMMFLNNFIVDKDNTTTNLNVSITVGDSETDEIGIVAENQVHESVSLTPNQPVSIASSTPAKPKTILGKRNRSTMDEFEEQLLATIKGSAVEDRHYFFAMQIAEEMRGMDPMLAMLAKARITQTMFDLLYPVATIDTNNVSSD